MASQEQVDSIRGKATKCLELMTERLTTRPEWGEIDFKGADEALQRLRVVLAPLELAPLHLLPDGMANQIVAPLSAVESALRAIDDFKLSTGGEPVPRRDQLVSQLSSQVNALYPVVTPHIPFLAYQQGDVDRNIQEMVKRVTEATEFMNKAKQEAETRRIEVDKIVQATREASAEAGVGVFTTDFAKLAAEYAEGAKRWLMAAGAAGFLTACAVVFFMITTTIDKDTTTQQLLHLTMNKVLIVLILGTVALWCGKMFKAAKHQHAVNAHRANALKTFQAFVQATEDTTIKDAVLLETTRSIFAIGSSGYLDNGNDVHGDGVMKIFEMVKTSKA